MNPLTIYAAVPVGRQFFDALTAEYYEKLEGGRARCISAEDTPRTRRGPDGLAVFEAYMLVSIQ